MEGKKEGKARLFLSSLGYLEVYISFVCNAKLYIFCKKRHLPLSFEGGCFLHTIQQFTTCPCPFIEQNGKTK